MSLDSLKEVEVLREQHKLCQTCDSNRIVEAMTEPGEDPMPTPCKAAALLREYFGPKEETT